MLLVLQRRHFALVRGAALLAAAAVLLAAGLYALAEWQRRLADQRQREGSELVAAMQAELDVLREGQRELDTNLDRYLELSASGFTGAGDRIAWAEALLRVQRRLQLPELSFELAAHVAIVPPGSVDPALEGLTAPAATVMSGPLAHDMTVQLAAIHEGELLDLLQGLADEQVGHFRVQRCQLQRNNEGRGIDAQCVLRWVTYQPIVASIDAEPPQ